jgi:hypothetical protein
MPVPAPIPEPIPPPAPPPPKVVSLYQYDPTTANAILKGVANDNLTALANALEFAAGFALPLEGASVEAVEAGAASFFEGTIYSSKVLEQMQAGVGEFHSFPESVTAFEDSGSVSDITGGDGQAYQLLQIPGSYQSTSGTWYDGTFEFMKDANGVINHRLFVPGP